MQNVLSCLRAHASRAPWHPFLVIRQEGQWIQLSYRDTLAEVERWAERLASLGLPDRSVVCIAIPHAPELYILFLAAMRAGLIPSFLAYATPKQQADVYWTGLADLLARTTPSCIIVEPRHIGTVQSLAGAGCLVTSPAALCGHAAHIVPLRRANPEQDAIALLQHSSGTTGSKKGVALTHAQIARQVASYSASIGATPADRIVSWLPLYHDMGLITGFLLPLSIGATIVSLDAFEWLAKPTLLFETIELTEATFAWMPNFAFAHMVRVHDPAQRQANPFDLGSIRAFISCSEPCKPSTMEAFAACFADYGVKPEMLQTCYAMAESVFGVTQSPIGAVNPTLWVDRQILQRDGKVAEREAGAQGAIALLPCGTPVDGIEVAIDLAHPAAGATPSGPPILDATLARADTPVGEIVLRGAFMFREYYRNPDATGLALSSGWYRTGDLGFLREGQLYVTGRKKEVLIVHGRNFYAHDIEESVSEVEGVKPGRVAVVGRFDDVAGSEQVLILAEMMQPGDPAEDAIRRRIRQHVFDRLDLTVRTIELFDPGTLVKTTSGKVARAQTAARVAPRDGSFAEAPPPQPAFAVTTFASPSFATTSVTDDPRHG